MDLNISKNDYITKRDQDYKSLLENLEIKTVNNSRIIISNNEKTIDVFINNCILYYLDHKYNLLSSFIGLDFEFNNGKIALCQIGLYYDDSYTIYIIDPRLLSDKQLEIFIETILISPINRIVHGADSLDIPYIFNELFHKNNHKIIKFTDKMIDTRYLCEYHKIRSKSSNIKCSIYDALLYFNTIDETLYNQLNRMMDSIHYNRTDEWNIKKLSQNHILYTAYDVIFLKDLLNNIINKANKSLEFIPNITRFIYYVKWKIYDSYSCPTLPCTFDDIKIINDNANNNFIIHKKKKITLLTIYNKYIKTIYLEENDIYIEDILNINYFKSVINNFLKYIIYGILARKYKIYTSIDILSENKFYIDNIITTINKLELKKISILFTNFINYVGNIIFL